MIPVLKSERLTLRGWTLADFPAYAEFAGDAARMAYNGTGSALSRADAWDAFCARIGEWELRGYGTFAIEETASARLCGYTGLWHPEFLDEPELLWSLFEGFEGKGLASEAARTVKDWAHDTLGLPPLFSFIHPDNARSRALAERLGAAFEKDTTLFGMPRKVFRHPLPTLN